METSSNKNDAAAPIPFPSFQNSSINSSTNQQIDIYVDGTDDGTQKGNNGKDFTNTYKWGNIDINLGGNKIFGEKETETCGKPTNNRNIDINMGGNGRVKENETYGNPN